VRIIRYKIQIGRPNTNGFDLVHPQKSSENKKSKIKYKYQKAFSFFGNQNGRFFKLFPPDIFLPFPGFMGWKRLKQCPFVDNLILMKSYYEKIVYKYI
jgi:hypothetical protein